MSGPDASRRGDSAAGRPRLVDSPWFWLLVFANAALVGVTLIGPKYNRRQGAIERRYEARQEIARRLEGGPAGVTAAAPESPAAEELSNGYSSPGDAAHIVPLKPLAVALVLLNSAAIVLFCVSRLRLASHRSSNSRPP